MRNLRVGKWQPKETNILEANGLIRINPNKPDFGSMMLVEDVVDVNGSFVRKRNKTGFLTGTVADLKTIVNQYGLKEGDNFNEKVGKEFRIVTDERLEGETPEGRAYKEKINPRTGHALTAQNGQKIFWRRYVVPVDAPDQDHLIQHENDERMGTVRGEQHYENVSEEAAKEFRNAAKAQTPGK